MIIEESYLSIKAKIISIKSNNVHECDCKIFY